jgi:hypothetical protein
MKKVKNINKVTDEELKAIRDHQEALSRLIQDIGVLETKKHAYCHEIAELNKVIDEFKEILESTYGSININVEDGSYTDIDVEDNKKD